MKKRIKIRHPCVLAADDIDVFGALVDRVNALLGGDYGINYDKVASFRELPARKVCRFVKELHDIVEPVASALAMAEAARIRASRARRALVAHASPR